MVAHLRCQGHRELIHELCHPDWLGQVLIEFPESLGVEFNEYLEQLRGGQAWLKLFCSDKASCGPSERQIFKCVQKN